MSPKDFPILKEKSLIYFDNAATKMKPQVVIDSISDFYENHCGTVHRAVYELANNATHQYHEVRSLVQHFLGAKRAEEIIFTSGTTDAINLLAYSFGKAFIQPGDEIILSEIEHHANLVPWQNVCEDRGAVLKFVQVNDQGILDLEHFKQLLSPKTKLVAVAHVSNSLGTVNPIQEIVALAHQHGAKVFVDGAQAVPHMPVNLQELGVDFYAFSGHKIYGPTGVGILYGRYDLLEQMPPAKGGGDMVDTVTLEKSTFQKPPLKFEAGTPPIAQVIGLGAAIRYLQAIGMENIFRYEMELLHYANEKLKEVPGLMVMGTAPDKGALITFNIAGIHPLDIGTMLNLKGIAVRTGHLCTQTAMARFGVTQAVRASFALYNTREEVDRFVDALKEISKRESSPLYTSLFSNPWPFLSRIFFM